MQKEFFIFIGRTGSGKSTISKIFLKNKNIDYLEFNNTNNTEHPFEIIHISTGKNFRKFNNKNNYTTELTKNLMNNGDSMPEFLAIWNWSDVFTKNIKKNTSIILDGAPRRKDESKMLIEACKFYNYKTITVIYLNIDTKISKKRILDRVETENRNDDTQQNIIKKNKWFEKDVLPILEYYKNLKDKQIKIKIIEIDANNNIDKVWSDLKQKVF